MNRRGCARSASGSTRPSPRRPPCGRKGRSIHPNSRTTMPTYLWNQWSIFDELERSMFATSSSEWPQFDIEDTDDETLLTADLPGMTEDDVEITLEGAYLTVRGERK